MLTHADVLMRRTLAGLAVSLTPLAGQAQALPPAVAIDRQIWASFDEQNTAYKEHFPAGVPGNDREDGWTPGFGLGARWIAPLLGATEIYGSVDYHHQFGTLAYTGTRFGTDVPLSTTTGLTTDDVLGELGVGFMLTPDFVVTPVVQVGYHTWRREIFSDEIETYSHMLAGAAVRANYAFTSRLVATLRLGLAGTIDPHIDIHYLGTYPQSLGGAVVEQASGKLDFALTRQFHVFAAVDASHWTYGESRGLPFSQGGTIFEPNSTTRNVTLSTGIGLDF